MAGEKGIAEARELGRVAARNAASWVVDGNSDEERVRSILDMLDQGDPEAYDYLPATPNLSGEWADDWTPQLLFVAVIGRDPHTDEYDLVDALAEAWEEGVLETFVPECERIMRQVTS